MKTLLTLIGIVLIILGISTFAYRGFSYTKQEKIAQIGSVQITQETKKTIYFPPILGGFSLIAGAALLIFGRKIR